MSKFDHTSPQELPPEIDILYLSRRRVTRRFTLGTNNSVADAIYRAYGASDPAAITSATTGFANLRLIQQKVQPSVDPSRPSVLVQVFETLTTELSLEASDIVDFDLNGLKRVTRQLIGSKDASTSAFVVGTQTYVEGGPTLYLAQVKIDKNEAFTRVNAVYLEAGVISDETSESNNGALTVRSITAWKTIPSTPSGFVIVGTAVQNGLGFPTNSYRFARGTGVVATENSEDSAGALLRTTVRALSAPATSNPIASMVGYYALPASFQEVDGHRVWTQSFVKGEGEVDRTVQGDGANTKIQIRYLSALAVGTLPIPTPAGFTCASYSEQKAEGFKQWSATYVKVTDAVDYELNGLKRITRTIMGDVEIPAIGVDSYGGCYLAAGKKQTNDVYAEVVLTYLEAGVISKTKTSGEIVGTIMNTWTVWHADPAVLMQAELGTVVPVSLKTENVEGYPVVTLSALSGTVFGTKLTYKTIEQVTLAGTITPTTVTTPLGSVATLSVVPPRTKTLFVTATVSIVADPPADTPSLAYNLENISASATSVSQAYNAGGDRVFREPDGNITFRGARWSASVDARITTFPNHYYTAASATGSYEYDSDWTDSGSGNIHMYEAQTSTHTTLVQCSGSGTASGYSTTGILQRKVRLALTDLNGVNYWEVITFTV